MNISVILPSRGHPAEAAKTCRGLVDTAYHRDSIEMLVRVDDDDLTLPKYVEEFKTIAQAQLVIGPTMKGYLSLPEMVDELAAKSKGEVLFLWNDDAEMETFCWDEVLLKACQESPWLLIYGHVSSELEGRDAHYPFAFYAVSRRLYSAVGSLAPHPNMDRVWEAYSCRCGGRQVDMWMVHHYHESDGTGARGTFYKYAWQNWDKLCKEWDQAADEMARKVRLAQEAG
jgi:hypothetical protein